MNAKNTATNGGKLDDLPDVLRVDQVAELMQVSKDAIYDAARRGEIPSIRVGRKIRFAKVQLIRLLEGDGDP